MNQDISNVGGKPYFSTRQNLLKKIERINIDPIYWKNVEDKEKYRQAIKKSFLIDPLNINNATY